MRASYANKIQAKPKTVTLALAFALVLTLAVVLVVPNADTPLPALCPPEDFGPGDFAQQREILLFWNANFRILP
jgi:hypothetical protein